VLNSAPHHKNVYGSGRILNLGTRWNEWSALRPGSFTPEEKSPPGTHWIGSWVGLEDGLEAVAKREKSLPLSGIELQSSSP
jgi:hypothetical protein